MRTTQFFMWLFLLVLPNVVLSANIPFTDRDICEPARRAGVNMTQYSESVAHSLHPLSVEDIRYFFDEKFPIDNTVPTVNFDLTGTPVLPYAPSRPSAFKFPAGATFDFILSNNDQPNKFGALGMTNLEELMHQMHMLEMWHMASKVYKKIATKHINTEKVCPCLVNEQQNGIFDDLNSISKLFHKWIPAPMVDGERRVPRRQGRCMGLGYWYGAVAGGLCSGQSLKEGRRRRHTEDAEMMEDIVDDEKAENNEKSIDGEVYRTIDGKEYQIVPELKDSKTWNSYWKSKVVRPESKEVKEQHLYNFAMYMYCKINM